MPNRFAKRFARANKDTDNSRYATFTRRSIALGGGMAAIFTVLSARLYKLQILDGSEYMTQAEDNRVNQRLISPPRGRILDRFGVELANNRRNYRVLLVAEQASDGVKAALDTIGKVITLTDRQRERVFREIAQNKKFVAVTVAENLSWEEFSRINLHLPYLPGVQPDVGETRAYPFGTELSHILGYVAGVSVKDKENADPDPLLDLPGFRIGKKGIEKEFDAEVRGTAGASRVEVNAYGRVIRELGRDSGAPGKDVYLTIDQELQRYTDQRLAGESAACVVMDCQTGDVLTLSSTPGFDPNLFNIGVTNKQWKELTTDDHKPLLNKAISGVYPPGSTFKAAVALAAYDAGIATPDYHVFCGGAMNLGSHSFHCWKRGGHGTVDLHNGLKHSCDVFFYETARRLGIDRLEEAARKLGFGAPTGLELPGERSGLIPSRAWKLANFGTPWQQGETLIAGIGQGYVTATPLQLATLAARIGSGKAVRPRIAHVVGDQLQPRPEAEALPFTPEAFAAVRGGMNGVSNETGGTAYGSRISEAGFELAGKTGTAQVRRISKEERARGVRRNEDLPWRLRDHALFIAFAPVLAPRYAISVVIEHGSSGSGAASPVARDVLLFAQRRNTLGLPTGYPSNAAGIGSNNRQGRVQTPERGA